MRTNVGTDRTTLRAGIVYTFYTATGTTKPGPMHLTHPLTHSSHTLSHICVRVRAHPHAYAHMRMHTHAVNSTSTRRRNLVSARAQEHQHTHQEHARRRISGHARANAQPRTCTRTALAVSTNAVSQRASEVQPEYWARTGRPKAGTRPRHDCAGKHAAPLAYRRNPPIVAACTCNSAQINVEK